MEVQRNFFIFAFLFVSFLLWQEWKSEVNFIHKEDKIHHLDTNTNSSNDIPKKYIIIKNDVLSLVVNLYGGDIEKANLLVYKDKLHSSQPFTLLETQSNFLYQAQSGLIGKNGIDDLKNNNRPLYTAKKNVFKLHKNQKKILVPLAFMKKNGIFYTKQFILEKGSYSVDVKYFISNTTNEPLEISMFGQLTQTIKLPKKRDTNSSNFALQTFRGAAYSSLDEKYEKYKFSDIAADNNLNINTKNVWIAMLQQYFATAWIPERIGDQTIYTSHINNQLAAIGYKTAPIKIPAYSNITISSKLWIGPEIQKEMALVAPYLDLTVDYGWLWFLSQPLFKLLSFLYNVIGNWGFSIVAITFLMKAITYPLTKAQYVSMAKMRLLQPQINEIKKLFSTDKKRISQEMMLLYKKEKINPLGGCLPVLIQMPIFLSLYYMLMGSVELRHAPFIFWIIDLSGPDPYYILPIIMGATMFFIQQMSSLSDSDSEQQKIMYFMPLIFTAFFLWFPSGLVLYYIVSNLVTIMQQKFIFYRLNKK